MEHPIALLLADFPALTSDSIRMLLLIESEGPLVRPGFLSQELGWSKSRTAKTLNDVTGRTHKKTWFASDSEATKPVLVREDDDPSDLRVKLLSLTPLAERYLSELEDEPVGQCVDYIWDQAINGTGYTLGLFPAHFDKLCLIFLRAKAKCIDCLTESAIDALCQWIDYNAVKDSAKMSDETGIAAQSILDFLKQSASKEVDEEIQRIETLINCTFAAIEFQLKTLTGCRLETKDVLALKIKNIITKELLSTANSCLKAWTLLEYSTSTYETHVLDRDATSALKWCVCCDTFLVSSNYPIESASALELIQFAKCEESDYYFAKNSRAECFRALQDYVMCFYPLSDADKLHSRAKDFSIFARELVEVAPNARPGSGVGCSAFFNLCLSKKAAWVDAIIQACTKSNILPLFIDEHTSDLAMIDDCGKHSLSKSERGGNRNRPDLLKCSSKSFGGAASLIRRGVAVWPKKPCGILFITTDDSTVSQLQIADFREQLRELNIGSNIHYMLSGMPLSWSPLMSNEAKLERIYGLANIWNSLGYLALGDIFDHDFQILSQWGLGNCGQLPPLDNKLLADMPTNRVVRFTPERWLPVNVDDAVENIVCLQD